MALRVITPPADAIVGPAELKEHLRVTTDDEFLGIVGYEAAAHAAIAGPDGWLGRCLITTTLELTVDRFPAAGCAIRLPCPPLQSVTSVTYVDQDGTAQTLAKAVYQVLGIGDQGSIVLAYNQTWPRIRRQPEAITIKYVAGYGDNANAVPESLRAAVKLMVTDLFDQRGDLVTGPGFGGVHETGAVRRLLMPFKVYQP